MCEYIKENIEEFNNFSTLVLKIKTTKNNTFLSLSLLNGRLISYKSLKKKKGKDIQIKITWSLVLLLKKVSKVQFIHLYVQNVNNNILQYILHFFKLWNIQVTFFKYDLPIPHNGCRRSHKARNRNKGRKKNIIT